MTPTPNSSPWDISTTSQYIQLLVRRSSFSASLSFSLDMRRLLVSLSTSNLRQDASLSRSVTLSAEFSVVLCEKLQKGLQECFVSSLLLNQLLGKLGLGFAYCVHCIVKLRDLELVIGLRSELETAPQLINERMSCLISTDPDFVVNSSDVVGLYLDPYHNALVLVAVYRVL
jgi:hypothetical protein